MALATLSIDLVAQIANLQAGMENATRIAQQHADKIQANFAKLTSVAGGIGAALAGAFTVDGLVLFVRNTATAIDALNDAADATGATVEQLSALEQVALRNGASLDTVTGIMVKFNAVLKDADKGSVPAQVLKAIGVEASELRRLDPADALKRVAVALQGFEDNGNKARIVQELFGKSVREAAPFLKDLAEAGELNATVTAKQAEEAEKFNKNLARMAANATNFGRAILGDALPALNEMFVRFQQLEKLGGVFGALRLGISNRDQFTDAAKGVDFYTDKLKELRKQQEEAGKRTGIGFIDRQNAGAIGKEIEDAQKLLNFYSSVAGGIGTLGAGGGRGLVNPDTVGGARGKLPDIAGIKAIGAPKKPEFRLTGADLFENIFGGKLAESLAKDGPLSAGNLLGIEEALKSVNGDLTLTFELLSQTPSFKLAETRKEMQTLAAAFEQGLITAEQFTEAAQTRLGLLPQEVKPVVDEMQEYLKQFQRNVQDILGDGVESILQGNFDNIGKSFGDMLRKMAAQAIAADLGNQLFGKLGADGSRSGGIFASLVSTIGSFLGFANGGVFAGGAVTRFANGGVVGGPTMFGMRGGLGLMGEAGPEAIMPLRRGRDGKLGVAGGGTVINNYNVSAGVQRSELMAALQMMASNIGAQTDAKLRRAGVA